MICASYTFLSVLKNITVVEVIVIPGYHYRRNLNLSFQSVAAASINFAFKSLGMRQATKKRLKEKSFQWQSNVHFTLLSCSKFPPSLHAAALPSGLCEELKAAALVPMDALLLQLLPLHNFAEVLLQPDQRELNSSLLYWSPLPFFFLLQTLTLAHVSQFVLQIMLIL